MSEFKVGDRVRVITINIPAVIVEIDDKELFGVLYILVRLDRPIEVGDLLLLSSEDIEKLTTEPNDEWADIWDKNSK